MSEEEVLYVRPGSGIAILRLITVSPGSKNAGVSASNRAESAIRQY